MNNHFIQLGHRHAWGGEQPFGISNRDQRQHLLLLGASGTGKTTAMVNIATQLIEAGSGFALIDPHGDAAKEILDQVPAWRIDHVAYFDAADREFPISLNPLASVAPERRHLQSSAIISAFKHIWHESWGPRMEYILAQALAAAIAAPNTSLLSIHRMLSDPDYRRQLLRHVEDPLTLHFWRGEFESWDKRFQAEAVAPVINKIGRLLLMPTLRNLLGQVWRGLDIRFAMDNQRVVICNLARGKLGEDASNLLGALLVSEFQQAALSRADLSESDRPDFLLMIDEFATITSSSFISILAEARKYRLGLALAAQTLELVSPEVQSSVLANTANLCCFRLSEKNAQTLSRSLGGLYAADTFSGLSDYEMVARVLNDGAMSDPFLARSMPPSRRNHGAAEKIIARSRERFSQRQEIVEDQISRWMKGRS